MFESVQIGCVPVRVAGGCRLESVKYKGVFAAGKKVYVRTVMIWFARGEDAGRKAGVVVSKRVFRRAVDRNRAKRLMREAFRLKRHMLGCDVDLIMVARKGIAGRSCAEVALDLETVFRRSGLTA
ncbi:MAG: ribonuclease P protein component [Kiritimatiellae bacterium]|nr:ribonuclease P protein component [Kiritimatiellia bacterium]